MTKIQDFIGAASSGFAAVAERRNLDMLGLATSLSSVDAKAETVAAHLAEVRAKTDLAYADAATADALARAANANAETRLSRDISNGLFSVFSNAAIGLYQHLMGRLTPENFGAVGDGIEDDTEALERADAQGALRLTRNYRITRSVTFTSPLMQGGPNGRLTIDEPATVTLSQHPALMDKQVFYGLGKVAGLAEAKAIWFAGDFAGTFNDARARLQIAADALIDHGTLWLPPSIVKCLAIVGDIPVYFTRGQNVRGNGGVFGSTVYFTSRVSNVFAFTGPGSGLYDVSIATTNPLYPTEGTALYVTGSFFTYAGLCVRAAFIGVEINGTSGGSGQDFKLFDCFKIGLLVRNLNDFFVDDFLISSPLDWLEVEDVSGLFTPGETLTAPSGALAIFENSPTPVTLRAAVQNVNFIPGEVITGATSGATAVLVNQAVPHQLGGVRQYDKVEAFIMTRFDVIGGKFSMTTGADVYAPNARPGYNKIGPGYFDSADEGVLLDQIVEFDFISTWFSNRPGNGFNITKADGVRFTGGGAINCWGYGGVWGPDAKGVGFLHFAARGNSQAGAGLYRGLLADSATDWSVVLCDFRDTLGFGTQSEGLLANNACDRYVAFANKGVVNDLGTGTTKFVDANF